MIQLKQLPSANQGPRPDGVTPSLLILHYTGMGDGAAALARLTDPASGVSAHYTVDEDGTVFAHVDEDRRAWHAGVARWKGEGDVNSRSVGVEIVNPGHEFGYRPFPQAQMRAVAELCQTIMARWDMPAAAAIGHSDVAPTRKQDPGELFDWAWLAEQGVGVMPRPQAADFDGAQDDDALRRLLNAVGYDDEAPLPAVLTAFQRHFLPQKLGLAADAETFAVLRALARG